MSPLVSLEYALEIGQCAGALVGEATRTTETVDRALVSRGRQIGETRAHDQ